MAASSRKRSRVPKKTNDVDYKEYEAICSTVDDMVNMEVSYTSVCDTLIHHLAKDFERIAGIHIQIPTFLFLVVKDAERNLSYSFSIAGKRSVIQGLLLWFLKTNRCAGGIIVKEGEDMVKKGKMLSVADILSHFSLDMPIMRLTHDLLKQTNTIKSDNPPKHTFTQEFRAGKRIIHPPREVVGLLCDQTVVIHMLVGQKEHIVVDFLMMNCALNDRPAFIFHC